MATRVISAGPVARYVKACNSCCHLLEFGLDDARLRRSGGPVRSGYYVACPRPTCMHESWLGEDEPDVVARCRIYATGPEADLFKELKR